MDKCRSNEVTKSTFHSWQLLWDTSLIIMESSRYLSNFTQDSISIIGSWVAQQWKHPPSKEFRASQVKKKRIRVTPTEIDGFWGGSYSERVVGQWCHEWCNLQVRILFFGTFWIFLSTYLCICNWLHLIFFRSDGHLADPLQSRTFTSYLKVYLAFLLLTSSFNFSTAEHLIGK